MMSKRSEWKTQAVATFDTRISGFQFGYTSFFDLELRVLADLNNRISLITSPAIKD